MQLVCARCGIGNHLPDGRLVLRVSCGRCGADLMPVHPVALNDAVFDRFIAGTELPVLVEFWADWCGPCHAMAPQFESAATLLPSVRFAKVDSDANRAASERQRIRRVPTLVLFDRGRELARRSGPVSADELVRWVRQQLAAASAPNCAAQAPIRSVTRQRLAVEQPQQEPRTHGD